MNNNLAIFDSKNYSGRGKPWTAADTALATAMATVPTFFIVLYLATVLPALIWVLWPSAALAIGQGWRKGIQTHRYYGLGDTQVEAIESIESLPDEVKARYGDDYVNHIREIGTGGNASNFYFEIGQLKEKARITEENRKEHEMAPVVEAMRETTKEISIDLKLLDPGPLQLTSGPSRKAEKPGWKPAEDDYYYR